MSMLQNFGICIIIFCFVSFATCLKCYQCNSAVDPGCDILKVNDTNSIYYKECKGDYGSQKPFCRKYYTNVLHIKEPENAIRISRSCGWIRNQSLPEEAKCKKDDSDFIKKVQCLCFDDGCNHAGFIEPSKLAISLLIVIPFLQLYF